jgi:alkaline phosphatase D
MIFERKYLKFLFLSFCIAALFSCSQNSKTEPDNFRIAFGSCAGDWAEQPIWSAIEKDQPDLYISLGDAIYADWDGEKLVEVTPELLAQKWQALGTRPDFAELKQITPMIATWDNHDYGSHDRGADFPLKNISKSQFLNFWDEPGNTPRRETPGIYTDYFYGAEGKKLHVILLDTKSFKNETELLGGAQWDWVQGRLKMPADLTILVSSIQIIPDEKNMDEWGRYPKERERLLDMVNNLQSLFLLSGNVHFAEISSKQGLIEVTSSGLTDANINKKYASRPNQYRTAGPVVQPHYGVLDIDWADLNVKISIRSESGEELITRQIEISTKTDQD